jgi:hypothetical protein
VEKTFEDVCDLALDLNVPAGEIAIHAHETDMNRVELTLQPGNDAARELLDSGSVTVELRQRGDGSQLVVDVPERRGVGWLGRGPQFDLRIVCPAGARTSVRSGSADVEARGTLGALDLKTASGDVSVERVDGEVKIASASGDVEVESALGPVDINTASGDIELGRVERHVRANLVSGDFSLREAMESLKVNSVSGDLDVDAVQSGKIELHSVSGDIDVGVRRGIDVWMDVRSISGDMRSDLTPTDGPGEAESGELVELHIKSVSGDVHIEHAPAATT